MANVRRTRRNRLSHDCEIMRISPEPLHPLRRWRELWRPEPFVMDHGYRERASSQTEHWKQPKRNGFHWLSHLFNRDLDR